MTAYPPEPWNLQGTGAITTWKVPVSSLPDLPDGVRPAGRRTALVTTAFVRYDERGLMAYDELLAAVVVRHGRGLARPAGKRDDDLEVAAALHRPRQLRRFGRAAEDHDAPFGRALCHRSP